MRLKTLFRLALAVLTLSYAAWVQADLARVGPSNVPAPPGNGFPKWYQDLDGLVLDLCMPDETDPGALQQTACLLETNPPYVFPTSFPDEAFYFRSVSELDTSGNTSAGLRGRLVLALEAAFANGAAAPGDQMVFTRIRVIAGVPYDGTYRVTHPYGSETFVGITSSGGNRDIIFTEDIGVTPGDFKQALTSRVGPFLQRADAAGNPAGFVTLNGAQFLSDGVALETVTGSPFGTNYFEMCGPFDGPNAPERCVRTNEFSLTGRVHNNVTDPIGSPLAIDRATYARDATGTRVDVSASATAGIGQAVPKLSAGAVGLPPVLLSGPSVLGNYYAQGAPLPPGTVPGILTVTNSADVPPNSVTRHVVDEIEVTSATYDPGAKSLVVVATSSDKGDGNANPPVLALEGFPSATMAAGTFGDPASVQFTVTGVAVPPASAGVVSSAGGQGRRQVTMLQSATPFPAGVPLALDDLAGATASGPAISIPVEANDVANALAPINTGPVTILAPGLSPDIGTLVANADGTVSFTPSTTTGTATFRYYVTNAVGNSNVATVTINVVPPSGGPVPIANNDPGPNEPAISLNPSTSRVIDVLANDSGNGGTLNPASVAVTTPPAAGTAVANGANGTITYNAPATAGTFAFAYTVANTNGNVSAPATVTVNVVPPETIVVIRARCSVNSADWDVRGTSSVASGNTITVYLTAAVPTSPTIAQILGSTLVDALGNWALRQKGGQGCTSPISLQSTLGTTLNNIAVQVK